MVGNQRSLHRARIACVSGRARPARDLVQMCANVGYEIASSSSASRADIGLVDLRGAHITPRRIAALTDALRQKSPESVILFLVDAAATEPGGGVLRRFGEVVPIAEKLDHVAARMREILRLRNIAEESGERLKSLSAANRVVEFPTIATDTTMPRALIVGSPGSAALETINALADVSSSCVCVLSAGQAMRALDAEIFDVAIFLPPTDDGGAVPALMRALKRHNRFNRTALLQIRESADAMASSARAGGPDFLLREQISSALGARAQLVSRRARLTRSMRSFLRACAGEGVRDPASGVFTPTFLAQHGARLAGRADQTGRPLSLALVHLGVGDAAKGRAESGTLRQAARIIGKVTRAEDMVSRISADVFAVLCPATTEADAQRIALRIEGVLTNTAFSRRADHSPVALNVTTAAIERSEGVAIAETVAEAMSRLRATSSEAAAGVGRGKT